MGLTIKRRKSEGGHKRGHSNMAHWAPTMFIKLASRKARRFNDKATIWEYTHQEKG